MKGKSKGKRKMTSKSQPKAVHKNKIYDSIGMIAIAIVVTILLVFLIKESRDLHNRMVLYESRAASLEEEIAEEESRTEEIEELKEYMQTYEYVEEIAREKLGLVKDNEIVFKETE